MRRELCEVIFFWLVLDSLLEAALDWILPLKDTSSVSVKTSRSKYSKNLINLFCNRHAVMTALYTLALPGEQSRECGQEVVLATDKHTGQVLFYQVR